MNIRTRTLYTSAASIVAAFAMSSCSVLGIGHGGDKYSGPERSTSELTATTAFTPGITVKIGEGSDAVTCTMGWVGSNREGKFRAFTAGHCADKGVGTPVSMNLNGEEVEVGRVTSTSFNNPYSPENTDLAVIEITNAKDNNGKDIPAASYANKKTPLKNLSTEDLHGLIADATGGKEVPVCWMTDVHRTIDGVNIPGSFDLHCGELARGNDSKLLVKADSGDYSPSIAGAPAWVGIKNGNVTVAQPVGVVTDYFKGHVVIDTLIKPLAADHMGISGASS